MRRAACLGLTCALAATARAAEPAYRAARSVHLSYPAPDGILFYNELVVEQSTPGSYFMACGWNTGYFGIQELGDGRKVILFSVWDPTSGDDPGAVKPEDRVEVLFSAPEARIRRFGGEGTGGQCMMELPWRIGENVRVLVRAAVEGDKTAFAGYVFLPGPPAQWKQLVTFRTRTGGQHLRGCYSFIEDFRRDGASVQDIRRARFGPGWVKSAAGEWVWLRRARFTASSARWEAKENIDTRLADGRFALATGGAITSTTALGSTLELPPEPAPLPPADLPGEALAPSEPQHRAAGSAG